jgi:alpha-L-fucosidase
VGTAPVLEQLRKWESLAYGMFLHFGMSTFDGNELSDGRAAASLYAPDALDVDQWVSVARDAGMNYAVLTAKHVAGHCLWPSRHTDYTVASSGDRTGRVRRFVNSCRKRGVRPGFYYCSWDNHTASGAARLPDEGFKWEQLGWECRRGTAARALHDLRLPELPDAAAHRAAHPYGDVAETWIDIPASRGRGTARSSTATSRSSSPRRS